MGLQDGECDAGASSPISIFEQRSQEPMIRGTGRSTGAEGRAQGARFALLSGAEPRTTG